MSIWAYPGIYLPKNIIYNKEGGRDTTDVTAVQEKVRHSDHRQQRSRLLFHMQFVSVLCERGLARFTMYGWQSSHQDFIHGIKRLQGNTAPKGK